MNRYEKELKMVMNGIFLIVTIGEKRIFFSFPTLLEVKKELTQGNENNAKMVIIRAVRKSYFEFCIDSLDIIKMRCKHYLQLEKRIFGRE